MVVYGLGMGLTSAPATESIMGAISRAKAGVGSAVNDSTRLVGGTLGVAVIGSVYASVYASRLTGTMPTAVPARSRPSHTSPSAPRTWPPARSRPSATRPWHRRCSTPPPTPSCAASPSARSSPAGVAAVGAVLAVLFLPAQPATLTAYQADPAQTDPDTPDRATPTAAGRVRPIRRRRSLSRLLVLVTRVLRSGRPWRGRFPLRVGCRVT